MVQLPPKLITVDEFIANYGDSDGCELIDGELTKWNQQGHTSKYLGRSHEN